MFKKKVQKNLFVFFLFIILFSCQPVEKLDDVIFDNSLLSKISLYADKKIINNNYEINYSEPYIDHSISQPPIYRLNNWLESNVNIFGSTNILIIDIKQASLTRIERKNISKKKYEEKNEYLYEIYFFVDYTLYDDNNFNLATVSVETKRTTTSSKLISLNEKEHIINVLILDSLIDVSLKSEELIKEYMPEYLL